MRLPIKDEGKNIEFISFINNVNQDLKDSFEKSIKKNLETSKIKVMLADFSVIETNTFDPNRVLNYFFNKEKEEKEANGAAAAYRAAGGDDIERGT